MYIHKQQTLQSTVVRAGQNQEPHASVVFRSLIITNKLQKSNKSTLYTMFIVHNFSIKSIILSLIINELAFVSAW